MQAKCIDLSIGKTAQDLDLSHCSKAKILCYLPYALLLSGWHRRLFYKCWFYRPATIFIRITTNLAIMLNSSYTAAMLFRK